MYLERFHAVLTLCHVDPDHPLAARRLMAMLEEDPSRLSSATDALAALGPRAKAAVPHLLRALTISDSFSVFHYPPYVKALQRIDPQASKGVWGAAGLSPQTRAANGHRSPAELQELWRDLAGGNSPKAYLAVWKLSLADQQSVPFLRERLRPSQAPPPAHVTKLLADLDSEKFAIREKATQQLTDLAELVESALREQLASKPSPEVRRRMEHLLKALGQEPPPEQRRACYAVQVLEAIGNAEAVQILEKLASGVASARLTK